MKRLILASFFLFFSSSIFSQIYAEGKPIVSSSHYLKMRFRKSLIGQPFVYLSVNNKYKKLTNEKNEALKFTNVVDVLDYFYTKGWKYKDQIIYMSSETGNSYFYLLEKRD